MPKSTSVKIAFFWDDVSFTLPQRSKIKSWLRSVFSHENQELRLLNIIFTSDVKLLEINVKHLKHNYYTDIITFCLEEDPICAELYISVDRVKDNAEQLRIPFITELCRVMVHGSLHLCGYSDKTQDEILVMRNKEDYYLKSMFVS